MAIAEVVFCTKIFGPACNSCNSDSVLQAAKAGWTDIVSCLVRDSQEPCRQTKLSLRNLGVTFSHTSSRRGLATAPPDCSMHIIVQQLKGSPVEAFRAADVRKLNDTKVSRAGRMSP